MKHSMRTPCSECPFRNDRPGYLKSNRVAEIVSSLGSGSSFPCHKTIDRDDDGNSLNAGDQVQCAGAEIFLAHQGTSTQLSRISEHLGGVVKLDMDAPVFRSAREMMRAQPDHRKAEEGEHCSVTDHGCLAPAGYSYGRVIVDGSEYVDDTWCSECGEPVCSNCRIEVEDEIVCNHCAENKKLWREAS